MEGSLDSTNQVTLWHFKIDSSVGGSVVLSECPYLSAWRAVVASNIVMQ